VAIQQVSPLKATVLQHEEAGIQQVVIKVLQFLGQQVPGLTAVLLELQTVKEEVL
jgi:hypothetical protein